MSDAAMPDAGSDRRDDWMWHVRRGDFAAAWAIGDRHLSAIPADEWRRPRHLQRIWRGQPVAGQRVLVRCYHGLGDTLQFARFIPALREVAREVTLWVQPPLLPLLATLTDVRLLPLDDGTPAVAYDVDVEVMELAHVLRATLDTLPPPLELAIDPLRRMPATAPCIGLAWRSGDWNPSRSLPAALARELVAGLPVTVDVLLHYLDDAERAHFAAPPPRTLRQVAAAMPTYDLVLTVDTVFAHLGGTTWRPTWVLLPADADWRWMNARDDSPWYPTMRLFRQASPGGWTALVSRVRSALAEWIRQRPDPDRSLEYG
jgi:hypothetical protein